MKKINKETLEAIVRLKNSDPYEFEKLLNWLKESRDTSNDVVYQRTKRDDEFYHWTQVGAAKELGEICKVFDDANSILKGFK